MIRIRDTKKRQLVSCDKVVQSLVLTTSTNTKNNVMYQQTLGRFLSRDPLAENGMDVMTDTGFYGERLAAMRANPWYYGGNSEHPYVYARNNPVRYTDPSGLWAIVMELPPPGTYGGSQTRAQTCACWVESEKKMDKSWLKKIPACPCSIGNPPENPDPAIWYWPPDESPRLHPGARWCIRSHSVPHFPDPLGLACQPGQQCCYDKFGNLITNGGGAGTPDLSAPVGPLCITGHYYVDVAPFLYCPLDIYLTYRPPDNRNNCPENPKKKG